MFARITEVSRTGNVLEASAEVRTDDEARELEGEAYIQRLRELSDRALAFTTGLPQDLKALVAGIDQPLRLCYVIASMLDMKGDDKQHLLEEERLVKKLQAVARALSREVTLLEADVSRARRRGLRDQVAAVLILQSHLDSRSHASDG